MTQKVILAILAFSLPFAAAASPKGATGSAAAPAVAAASAKAETFGAPVSAGEVLPLAKVLADPDAYAGKSVRLSGLVRAACTKKGCWMELSAPDGKGPGARVKFKDYGFFVPKDSAGASAKLEGTVQVTTLSAAQVAHYESEGGSFAKGKDGTAREIQIVATGVELTR